MPHVFVIFGASGDLTSRKLVPALWRLHQAGSLPADTSIVGFSRTPLSDEAWRDSLRESTARHSGSPPDEASWNAFAARVHYQPGDIGSPADMERLRARLAALEGPGPATRVYYLATAPQFYEPVVAELGRLGMAAEEGGPRRIVVEKPFGTDLDSARRLKIGRAHV